MHYCQPKMSFQQLNFRNVVMVGLVVEVAWGTSNIGIDYTVALWCSGLI